MSEESWWARWKRIDKAHLEKSKNSKIFKNPGFVGPFPHLRVKWPPNLGFFIFFESPSHTPTGKTKKITTLKNKEDGIVIIGEVDILSKICNLGVFVKAETQGICMIGTKK